jgi:tRNA-binding protein
LPGSRFRRREPRWAEHVGLAQRLRADDDLNAYADDAHNHHDADVHTSADGDRHHVVDHDRADGDDAHHDVDHRYSGDQHDGLLRDADEPVARAPVIEFAQFSAVDMRVGRIVAVDDFPEARVPAWKLTIDFGPELGHKRSSAQITHYTREQLDRRLVIGVVNLAPRQFGPFRSDVLVLGAHDSEKGVVLLAPDQEAELGSRIG